ncbi:unnamed protein product [Ixodes persulcatus]
MLRPVESIYCFLQTQEHNFNMVTFITNLVKIIVHRTDLIQICPPSVGCGANLPSNAIFEATGKALRPFAACESDAQCLHDCSVVPLRIQRGNKMKTDLKIQIVLFSFQVKGIATKCLNSRSSFLYSSCS